MLLLLLASRLIEAASSLALSFAALSSWALNMATTGGPDQGCCYAAGRVQWLPGGARRAGSYAFSISAQPAAPARLPTRRFLCSAERLPRLCFANRTSLVPVFLRDDVC